MRDAVEKEIASLKSDVEHIKEDTTEIKQSIAAFVAQSTKISVEMEGLRGRLRECEHDIIALKADNKEIKDSTETLKTGFTKLAVYVALAAGGATLTIDKILGLFR